MVVRAGEATCYVMDTYCRNITTEQRGKIEGSVAQICRRAALRKSAKRHHGD